MSTSNWQNISYNIDLIKKLNPDSILDIGVGFGRWGILFREFLEVWGDNNFKGEWRRIIDGIEIFPEYIRDYHKYFYNNIFIADALEHIQNTKVAYDLINCGDVIEHFEKHEGLKLIKLCLERSKYVLINIPIGTNWKQDSVNNNEYEKHRSIWQNSDFNKYKFSLVKKFKDIQNRDFSVILLSNEKINLNLAYGKYFGIKNFMRNKLKIGRIVDMVEGKV